MLKRADNHLSITGNAWLCGLRDQFKMSLEQYGRLEAEGGIAVTQDQLNRNEDLLSVIRRIDSILQNDRLH